MRKSFTTFIYFASLLVLVLSCTKNVGLITEVEFELIEQYQEEGAVNEALATTVTVVPEAELEGYTYFFSYTVSKGEGFYIDKKGKVLPQGEKIALNPLTAILQYKGSSIGEHLVKIKAEDSFGFTKEISLTYTFTEIFVSWTATSPDSKLQLGTKTAITVTLGDDAKEATSYERSYKITTGSGSFRSRPGGGAVIMNEFVPIVPGSYLYTFVPDALGNVVLEFNLKNDKGQQLTATINFEVVAQTLSDQNDITGFTIPGQASVASIINNDNHTVTVNVPSETDLNVAPTSLTISTGASISPSVVDVQDFNAPVTYSVTAENGNVQEWTIHTNVNSTTDTTKPIITLVGANPQNITIGTTYTELGATASDNIDGDITANITITGNVNTNIAGDYAITYNVSDAAGNNADPVIRAVTVSAVANQNPIAVDDTFTVVENSSNNPLDVLGNDSDPDGNTLSILSTTNPLNGTVTIVGGGNDALLYTPGPNFTGTDQFEYTINDGNGGTTSATVTITVNEGFTPLSIVAGQALSSNWANNSVIACIDVNTGEECGIGTNPGEQEYRSYTHSTHIDTISFVFNPNDSGNSYTYILYNSTDSQVTTGNFSLNNSGTETISVNFTYCTGGTYSSPCGQTTLKIKIEDSMGNSILINE